MKTNIYLSLLMIALLFTACSKNDHPNAPITCQVEKVTYANFGLPDSAVFTYNKKGNPVSIKRGQNTTGYPDLLFRYDKHDRLTEFIGIYADGDIYEFRHKYAFDYKDRIVSDTQYVFGSLSGQPDAHPATLANIATYQYDARNRIIRMDLMWTASPGSVSTYNYIYNQQGNIEKITDASGQVIFTPTYDDKINMNNLHPIWQFLARDYSRNNPFTAENYDPEGLPTKIDFTSKGNTFFAGIYFTYMSLEYKCQ
ncbi:hypothetical protein F0L74_21745 [Chitinophaga agrisoli]|uniref:YD repeat-containing protein n=1 Tax=Chitinophaga agrisoli TaxID=2607653 RepID=A0A5B2VID8_9BACT|nr:hypothetical protein [Chitinophaga agrisoli]KAA2238841.1 hypothetical protein F0L74_21745 [Chitinophaga agrisoli]